VTFSSLESWAKASDAIMATRAVKRAGLMMGVRGGIGGVVGDREEGCADEGRR